MPERREPDVWERLDASFARLREAEEALERDHPLPVPRPTLTLVGKDEDDG